MEITTHKRKKFRSSKYSSTKEKAKQTYTLELKCNLNLLLILPPMSDIYGILTEAMGPSENYSEIAEKKVVKTLILTIFHTCVW